MFRTIDLISYCGDKYVTVADVAKEFKVSPQLARARLNALVRDRSLTRKLYLQNGHRRTWEYIVNW